MGRIMGTHVFIMDTADKSQSSRHMPCAVHPVYRQMSKSGRHDGACLLLLSPLSLWVFIMGTHVFVVYPPDTADKSQSSRHIPCAVHLESLQILKSGRHDGACLLLLSALSRLPACVISSEQERFWGASLAIELSQSPKSTEIRTSREPRRCLTTVI